MQKPSATFIEETPELVRKYLDYLEEQLRKARARCDDYRSENDDLLDENCSLRRSTTGDLALALQAAHMLHEDAHGDRAAFRLCTSEPCRDLSAHLRTALPAGPAQLTLTGAPR